MDGTERLNMKEVEKPNTISLICPHSAGLRYPVKTKEEVKKLIFKDNRCEVSIDNESKEFIAEVNRLAKLETTPFFIYDEFENTLLQGAVKVKLANGKVYEVPQEDIIKLAEAKLKEIKK